MSGAPRVRSMNHPDSEPRSVLGPGGNKSRSVTDPPKKPSTKTKPNPITKQAQQRTTSPNSPVPSKLTTRSSLSMEGSCSSDASSDESTGRASKVDLRTKMQCASRVLKNDDYVDDVDVVGLNSSDDFRVNKRCAWVTSNTDQAYVEFHDEEWGVPVHDDRKLFELLSLCTALAELSWPVILNKRKSFREVFQGFDPVAVSKLNDKKIATAGSPASSLLSDLKLRAIIENARQTCKIMDEHGSFDKYIWGFVNYKPMVGHFRYPRQVPIKTSKADAISKDLIRRGFRGVGPTVVYSFMQVSGITNDHLIGCFRFQYCLATASPMDNKAGLQPKSNDKQCEDAAAGLGFAGAMDDLTLCT